MHAHAMGFLSFVKVMESIKTILVYEANGEQTEKNWDYGSYSYVFSLCGIVRDLPIATTPVECLQHGRIGGSDSMRQACAIHASRCATYK
jgi:hypothetical protein